MPVLLRAQASADWRDVRRLLVLLPDLSPPVRRLQVAVGGWPPEKDVRMEGELTRRTAPDGRAGPPSGPAVVLRAREFRWLCATVDLEVGSASGPSPRRVRSS